MNDPISLFQGYIVKNESKVKTICAPLQDYFAVPLFAYYSVREDGHIVLFSNNATLIQSYCEYKCYTQDPHIKHPSLMQSGSLFIPEASIPIYLQPIFKPYQINGIFLILNCYESFYEGFMFLTKKDQKKDKNLFALEPFQGFARYFKREAKSLIEKSKSERFNVKRVLGAAFFQCDSSSPLSKTHANTQNFLKKILPLTHREQQCLELFKQGKSAQATAAILGLSQRTVEYYFNNMKNKLGCHSKADLFEY